MKAESVLRPLFFLLLPAAVVIGCTQVTPVSRDQVVENLQPIVEIEKREQKLAAVMQRLPLVVEVDAESARQLKEHYDVYSVYHYAATISLAQGNLQLYRAQVRNASNELDSMERRLLAFVEKKSHPSQRAQ